MHPPVRLVAIDMDGTLLDSIDRAVSRRNAAALLAAQQAGITVAIATGRRTAYTTPFLEGLGLRADTPLITSNGVVTSTLGGETTASFPMPANVARELCSLLRPFGVVVFTFDRIGRGALVLEDLDQTQDRIAFWIAANREAIEVVQPLELALVDGNDPIQGMLAGRIADMRRAEEALQSSSVAGRCAWVRTEYPSRDLSIVDLLAVGVSKGCALERLADRLGVDRAATMAIGDNWNDVDMLEWAGQAVLMENAVPELKEMARLSGWQQAPTNDADGVAAVLEAVVDRIRAAQPLV